MKKIILSMLIVMAFIICVSVIVVGMGSKHNDDKITEQEEILHRNDREIKSIYKKDDLRINVYITKKGKIENMDIEDYVIGVVAGEMPAEFNIEALKAQAVAARTYGLAHKELFGAGKTPKIEGADVSDTTQFQVFMNKKDRMKLWPQKHRCKYWDKVQEAVRETEGEVLSYNGELVMAPYYFSTSSGKTEAAIDVFSKQIPYLQSVDSPGEEKSKKYRTEFNFTYGNLTNILNGWNKNFKLKKRSLKNQLNVIHRSKGGSVIEVKVGNKSISGPEFRKILNLTSANFYIKFNENSISIICKGYGHGVGMSQWGSNAMAKNGFKYNEILEHYYTGVKILKLKIK